MRALLDTCAFVWLVGTPERVPMKTRADLRAATLFVSTVTAWELAIKRKVDRLGALAVPDGDLAAYVERAMDVYGFEELTPTMRDAVAAGDLDTHHGDPFDRMLIAQAQRHEIPIVTPDVQFDAYGIERIW
jgi:PIN domain nuclease of toxin-antitoxin system